MKGAILGDDYQFAHPRTKEMSHSQLAVRNDIIEKDKAEDYEPVPCICGNKPDDEVVSEVERHGLPYRKLICMHCGLLRVSPRWKKERYDSFYEHQYRGLYNPIKSSKEEYVKTLSKHPNVQDIGNWIKDSHQKFGQQVGSPKVLEIGAGGGWILQSLPGDWIRTGYDVDSEYLELGKRLFNLEMKYGLLEEATADIRSSNIVVLSHVVEHFLDPVGSLELICRNMAANSMLLIEVPGVLRIHRTNLDPMTYMQNAHTYTFCAFTLKYVCLMAGFRVLAIDEKCRAICVKDVGAGAGKPVKQNTKIARFIIDYLIRCEMFYKKYSRVKSVKVLWPLAYAYKRLFINKMNGYLSSNSKDFNS